MDLIDVRWEVLGAHPRTSARSGRAGRTLAGPEGRPQRHPSDSSPNADTVDDRTALFLVRKERNRAW